MSEWVGVWVCGGDQNESTFVNKRSASSKSLRRTATLCSSALLFMYLPKWRWTLCMVRAVGIQRLSPQQGPSCPLLRVRSSGSQIDEVGGCWRIQGQKMGGSSRRELERGSFRVEGRNELEWKRDWCS